MTSPDIHSLCLMSRCCFCLLTKACPALCDPMNCSTPGFPVLHYLLEFAQIHVRWVVINSNHLILYPLLLLPSIVHSIRVFSNDLALHIRWPKYWSFSSSISSSNEYSGLISFRVDWFDLAVQGTLRVFSNTTFQKHQFLRCLAFFIVQLSHPYMTTEKTVPLTRRILQWVVIPFWVISCPRGNLGLPHCRQILYRGSHHLFSMLWVLFPPVPSPPYMVTGGVNGLDHLPHCNLRPHLFSFFQPHRTVLHFHSNMEWPALAPEWFPPLTQTLPPMGTRSKQIPTTFHSLMFYFSLCNK